MGRSLKKGDVIPVRRKVSDSAELRVFPWRANVSEFYAPVNAHPAIRCIRGNEFNWLTKKSQTDFLKQPFSVSTQSDRMGYRLAGLLLKQSKKQELLSTAVSFGTIQLLPNGELIALMADHQTTGGYPRIAHVISADRSRMAQCRAKELLRFMFIDQQTAEELYVKQEESIRQLQQSCTFKLKEINV